METSLSQSRTLPCLLPILLLKRPEAAFGLIAVETEVKWPANTRGHSVDRQTFWERYTTRVAFA